MIEAIRLRRHREQVYAARLQAGQPVYQPLPAIPPLSASPVLTPGSVADAAPLADFLSSMAAEASLLSEYAAAARDEISAFLQQFREQARPRSLLGSLRHVAESHALLFPALNLAIAPPTRWRLLEAQARVEPEGGVSHVLFAPSGAVPGDLLGLIQGSDAAAVTFTFPTAVTLKLAFFPCYPVVNGILVIGGQRYLPMPTDQGLYFWVDAANVSECRLELALGGQVVMIGQPLLADGVWQDAGELILTAPAAKMPAAVSGTLSGATLALSGGNIPGWTPVELGVPCFLEPAQVALVGVPENGCFTIPAGQLPRRVLRGWRCWYVERGVYADGVFTPKSQTYLPLEATNTTVSENEAVRFRCYLYTDTARTITATVPGTVSVSGIVQPAGTIALPAGESELEVLLTEAGTYRFAVPLPPDVPMRARYVPVPYTLRDGVLTLGDAPAVPHAVETLAHDRLDVRIRVSLPVTNGRPAAAADLRLS